MVSNNDTHFTPVRPEKRRLVPGWDYWALTLLAAPLATSGLGALIFPAFRDDADAVVLLGLFTILTALAGWLAPSASRLPAGRRAFWAVVTAALSLAVPAAAMVAALLIVCAGGECFS